MNLGEGEGFGSFIYLVPGQARLDSSWTRSCVSWSMNMHVSMHGGPQREVLMPLRVRTWGGGDTRVLCPVMTGQGLGGQ